MTNGLVKILFEAGVAGALLASAACGSKEATPTPVPTATPTPVPTATPILPIGYRIIKDGSRIPEKEGRTVGITPEGYRLNQSIQIGDAYELDFNLGTTTCRLYVWKRPPVRSERYDDVDCNGSVDATWIGPELFIRRQGSQPQNYWDQRNIEYKNWLQEMDLLEKAGQQTSLDQRLNPHMYTRGGVLKPQYASKKLSV